MDICARAILGADFTFFCYILFATFDILKVVFFLQICWEFLKDNILPRYRLEYSEYQQMGPNKKYKLEEKTV